MAYFIFNKNSNNQIYKIAENNSDLNDLNIDENFYLIVNTSQENFELVKLNNSRILNYNGSSVELENISIPKTRIYLRNYITYTCFIIDDFLNAQPNHLKYQQWKNYKDFLKTLNTDTFIKGPEDATMSISLEQYLKNNNQTYYNILQIP